MMHIVILCNGRAPDLHQIISITEKADLFIAADGGADQAEDLGLQPDLIIGDLDSYTGKPDESIQVIKIRSQETNDLEKALETAVQKGASDVTVFGAVGKRLDHTLKNLSVLKRFHSCFSTIRFIDRYGEFFLLPKKYAARLPTGTTISLFPLTGIVEDITTTGLKYPLKNETLQTGKRDGTSNVTVQEDIVITHKKGDLLLMIPTNTAEL